MAGDMKTADEVFEIYQREHANTNNYELIFVTYLLLGEKYEAALKYIDSVDQFLQDPFLELYRSMSLQGLGKSQEAMASSERFALAYPEQEAAYFLYWDQLITAKRFTDLEKSVDIALQNNVNAEKLFSEIEDNNPEVIGNRSYRKIKKKVTRR